MALLVAIGGLVGTGKTTLAYGLKKNASSLSKSIVIEDDQIRRELLGESLEQVLTNKDYAPEISAHVTEEINKRTIEALVRGISVINPSGFFEEASRQALQRLAEDNHTVFVGLWLVAPEETTKSRIKKRLEERSILPKLCLERGHASDADEQVISKFGDIVSPQSPGWKILDARLSEEALLKTALPFVEVL